MIKLKRLLIPVLLIVIGEGIFILPFLISRIFRPTFLKVFKISNFELGAAFSVYGIIAMLSYFIGGPIADRYSPKKLLTFSLLLTSFGGFYLADIPSVQNLTYVYGFWGLTTILFFWAAYIKAIRLYWQDNSQGKGFGIVDGGRGIFGALVATVSVALFSSKFSNNTDFQNIEELRSSLSYIFLTFSFITFFCGVLVYFFYDNKNNRIADSSSKISLQGIRTMAKKKAVWLNSFIVLCAYVAYKCTDDFSLYAAEVLHYNDVEAAKVGAISFWIRPIAAFFAGYLGDKFLHSKIISYGFLILIVGSVTLALGIGQVGLETVAVITIAATCIGIYGLRGVYFALMEEAKLDLKFIGSAVGIISVIGYSPDIFMGPLMGYILDSYPGKTGHHYLFSILTIFSILGLLSSYLFNKSVSNAKS